MVSNHSPMNHFLKNVIAEFQQSKTPLYDTTDSYHWYCNRRQASDHQKVTSGVTVKVWPAHSSILRLPSTFGSGRLNQVARLRTPANREDISRVVSAPVIKRSPPAVKLYQYLITISITFSHIINGLAISRKIHKYQLTYLKHLIVSVSIQLKKQQVWLSFTRANRLNMANKDTRLSSFINHYTAGLQISLDAVIRRSAVTASDHDIFLITNTIPEAV